MQEWQEVGPIPSFPLPRLHVGAGLAIIQGIAWGSRRCLWVTPIWPYQRKEKMRVGQAWEQESPWLQEWNFGGRRQARYISPWIWGPSPVLSHWHSWQRLEGTWSELEKGSCKHCLDFRALAVFLPDSAVHGTQSPLSPLLSSLPQAFSISVKPGQMLANSDQWVSIGPLPVFSIKFYWNAVTPVRSCIVCDALLLQSWVITTDI